MKNVKASVWALSAALLVGCGMAGGKDAADAAIAEFHTRYNDGMLDSIWENAHESFRDAGARDDYEKYFRAIERKLGKVIETANSGWRVNATPSGTMVLVSQSTKFERGKGVESFTFRMKGDVALLVGYNINSSELIVN